jgi:hypothetical protein
LVFGLNSTNHARLDSEFVQDQNVAGVGVRWAPLDMRPSTPSWDWRSTELGVGIGLAELSRKRSTSWSPFAYDHLHWAFAVTFSAAWLPIRGRDYAFGLQATDSISFYSTNDIRHGAGLEFVAKVDL